MDFKLHHIAYAVRDTDKSLEVFRSMFSHLEIYKQIEPEQDVFITYLCSGSKNVFPWIELVEPRSPGHKLHKLIRDQASTPYHLCFQGDSFEEIFNFYQAQKFFVLTKPFQMAIYPDFMASHMYHPNIGIIEVMGKLGDIVS